jgi:hypothetical protein
LLLPFRARFGRNASVEHPEDAAPRVILYMM